VTVVLTRSHARELGLETGGKVWLAANRGATTFPALHAVS
jgi:sulfate transport system ATP-binding protein